MSSAFQEFTDQEEARLRKTFKDELERFFGHQSAEDQPDVYDNTEADTDTAFILPDNPSFADPIAVQVVSDKPTVTVPRGSVGWTGHTTFVGQTAQLLVGKQKARRTVIIKNLSSLENIALDNSTSVKYVDVTSAGFGSAILPAGDSLVLDTTGEVWSIGSSSTSGVPVSIFQVFDAGQ